MIETDNEKSESYEKEIEHLKNQINKTNAELESRKFDDEITKKQIASLLEYEKTIEILQKKNEVKKLNKKTRLCSF